MHLILSAPANRVIDALIAADLTPLVVGGSVRDAVLGRESKDLDLEVHGAASLAEVAIAVQSLGAVAEQGAAFGILGVHVDGESFELSLAPSTSLAECFSRRDFTINAMGWDPRSEELIDLVGGQRDLAKGVLRHTSERFGDDPLRVLRGVRFAGQLGFRFAAETKGVARQLSDRYDEIALERVWGEWRRMARTAVNWPEALAALVDSGWDRHCAALSQTRGIPQDATWHSEGDVFTHLGLTAREAALAAHDLDPSDREVVVLAALLHDVGKVTHTVVSAQRITSQGHAEAGVEPAHDLLSAIGAPAAVVTRILPLIREHMAHVSVQGSPSRPAVSRLARRLETSGASLDDWARVVDADCHGRVPRKSSPAAEWLAIAASFGGTAPRGILTGEHLIARGLAPGPAFSKILRDAVAAQDDEQFSDEAGALRWLDARSDAE